MLLRRFADKREQVRVIHRDGRSFTPALDKFGLEKDFLGAPGPGTADEALTTEENRIAPVLQLASEAKAGAFEIDAGSLLVSHFTMRLRSLRTFMGQMANAALDAVEERFQDSDAALDALRQSGRDNPRMIQEEFDKQFQERYGGAALKRLKRDRRYPLIVQSLRNAQDRYLGQLNPVGVTQELLSLVNGLRGRVGGMIRDAHAQSIQRSPSAAGRANALRKFSFELVDVEGCLVLGDAVVWAARPHIGAVPAHSLEEDITSLVMPISPRRMLLGWVGERPSFSVGDANLASARTSEDFVITHPDCTIDTARLVAEFGKGRADAMTDTTRGLQTPGELQSLRRSSQTGGREPDS